MSKFVSLSVSETVYSSFDPHVQSMFVVRGVNMPPSRPWGWLPVDNSRNKIVLFVCFLLGVGVLLFSF